jgi:hypothetical protein
MKMAGKLNVTCVASHQEHLWSVNMVSMAVLMRCALGPITRNVRVWPRFLKVNSFAPSIRTTPALQRMQAAFTKKTRAHLRLAQTTVAIVTFLAIKISGHSSSAIKKYFNLFCVTETVHPNLTFFVSRLEEPKKTLKQFRIWEAAVEMRFQIMNPYLMQVSL